MLNKAIEAAKIWHKGQIRKDGEPYIHHPIRVMGLTRLYIGDNITIQSAAVLHDVLEDCDVKKIDISNMTSYEVSNIVLELTNLFTKKNYPNKNRKWRKEEELLRLSEISIQAKMIKLCDRYDNIRTKHVLPSIYLDETMKLIEKIGCVLPELSNLIVQEIESNV